LPLDDGASFDALANVLDDHERHRADRLIHPRDRRRFVAAHGLMRIVLGRYTDRPPASLRFQRHAYGKPRLADQSHGLRFNLSHTGGIALLAIARRREVGIDIEEHRPIAALKFARRFFSPNEHAALCAFAPGERESAFYRCWVRKESFVKALGRGLRFPIAGFEVSLARHASPLLRACSAAPRELGRWSTVSVAIDGGYAAAVTAAGRGWRVVHWAEPMLDA
jgi:4'-phosphopantetheinyl transferase